MPQKKSFRIELGTLWPIGASANFRALPCCLLMALIGVEVHAEAHIYQAPVVFQRFLSEEATPGVPGFYGGASIWIMEDDGSRVALLRDPGVGESAQHLDHPSVSSDGEYIIYAEFQNAALGVRSEAKLYKEDLGSRQRTVLREQSGCALHHATLGLDDQGLTYSRHCAGRGVMLTELFGQTLVVTPGVEGAAVANGASAGSRLIYQQEIRKPGQIKRSIAIVVSDYESPNERTDRVVADWGYKNRRPAISADRRYVAWQTNSTTQGGTDDIVILDLEARDSVPMRLTASDANDGHPWFSRDGLWLLFESDRSGNWEIYKMHLPSRKVSQLTDDLRYVSTRPRW